MWDCDVNQNTATVTLTTRANPITIIACCINPLSQAFTSSQRTLIYKIIVQAMIFAFATVCCMYKLHKLHVKLNDINLWFIDAINF